jgi:hypothetical protein
VSAGRFESDEDGLAGGAEAIVFGALVFVLGTLLVVNAWGVVDAKLATSEAAREATRLIVEASPDDVSDPFELAEEAATRAMEGYGKDPARVRFPAPAVEGGRLDRCARVTVTVAYDVPTVFLPVLGGLGSGVITAVGRHSEVVDPHRSGLPGEADCDF